MTRADIESCVADIAGPRTANPGLAFPPFSPPRRIRAELVAGILRGGRSVPDAMFDDIYPERVRWVSSSYWTPVAVCARAVELLGLEGGDVLLDVGAGVGKFCIVTAALRGVRVRGIERRPELVAIAQEAAHRYGIDIDIAVREVEPDDAEGCAAVYLFNPFVEDVFLPGIGEVPADRFAARSARDIAVAETLLRRARVGLRLVTFCGFGGTVPPDYERLSREDWDGGALELWEKRAAP